MDQKKLITPGIISSLICFASFITVRIADTVILSAFLRFNNIYHKYSIFHIEYLPGGQSNWTEGKVIFIYTLPYVIFALLGIYLPHLLRRTNNFWIQLSVNWLSFHMLLLLMAGLSAGIFQFRGVGVALEWFFVNIPVKVAGVIILLTVLIFATRRYGWYFLRRVPDRIYQDDLEYRRKWVNAVVLLPFAASFALIFPMSEYETWLNFVFSFLLGLISIWIIHLTLPMVYIPEHHN